jgi:hypothetical protein
VLVRQLFTIQVTVDRVVVDIEKIPRHMHENVGTQVKVPHGLGGPLLWRAIKPGDPAVTLPKLQIDRCRSRGGDLSYMATGPDSKQATLKIELGQ